MLLLNLTVVNFGVFHGSHSFELAPRQKGLNLHTLTIFSGHNGAGKTTLFQSMALALHGALVFGDKVESRQYNSFILNRMHRSAQEEAKDHTSDESSVSLSFQYTRSGRTFTVQIERHWMRQARHVSEVLTILQDNSVPDIEATDYQTWLNDLIPPGISRLCFFDAEHLDALASLNQQNKILGETLERLLGIDLVQRLHADIEHYTSKQLSPVKIDQLYTKMLEYRSGVDEIDSQLEYLRDEVKELEENLSNCEAALAQQERYLAAEGGAYAARRPILQGRQQEIAKEIEIVSNQLRELVAELLPFALARKLSLRLSASLKREVETNRQKSANALLQEKLPNIEAALEKDEFWEELKVASDYRNKLTKRLLQVIKENVGITDPISEENIIHRLAEVDHQKLQQWIFQALQTTSQQTQESSKRLKELKEEYRRIETDLQRAPDDAILTPIHEELTHLRGNRSSYLKQQSGLKEKIGSTQFQRTEKARLYQRVLEQYEKARDVEKQSILAERTKLVLHTYKDILTRRRLELLEEALEKCFNKICRKEYLLATVRIDPENFAIQLEGADDDILELDNFSAGERQIYVLALLWALRLVSGRQLPLAIDTPLARLDEVHRQHFVHEYIPWVSNQVLLFTTDAEFDSTMFHEVKPYLARTYRLQYDSELGESQVIYEDNLLDEVENVTNFAEEGVETYGV